MTAQVGHASQAANTILGTGATWVNTPEAQNDPYKGYVRYTDERRHARVAAYDDEFIDEESLMFGWLCGEWKDDKGKTWYVVRITPDERAACPTLNEMLYQKRLPDKVGELHIGAFTHVKLLEQ